VKGFQNDTLMNEVVLEMARSNYRLYKKLESYFLISDLIARDISLLDSCKNPPEAFHEQHLFRVFAGEEARKGATQTMAILIPKSGLNILKSLVP
jgi:hypothetical protein